MIEVHWRESRKENRSIHWMEIDVFFLLRMRGSRWRWNWCGISFPARSKKMKKKQHCTIQMINYASNHIIKWINGRGPNFHLAHSIETKICFLLAFRCRRIRVFLISSERWRWLMILTNDLQIDRIKRLPSAITRFNQMEFYSVKLHLLDNQVNRFVRSVGWLIRLLHMRIVVLKRNE